MGGTRIKTSKELTKTLSSSTTLTNTYIKALAHLYALEALQQISISTQSVLNVKKQTD
jgi:hypothetical protein